MMISHALLHKFQIGCVPMMHKLIQAPARINLITVGVKYQIILIIMTIIEEFVKIFYLDCDLYIEQNSEHWINNNECIQK